MAEERAEVISTFRSNDILSPVVAEALDTVNGVVDVDLENIEIVVQSDEPHGQTFVVTGSQVGSPVLDPYGALCSEHTKALETIKRQAGELASCHHRILQMENQSSTGNLSCLKHI